MKSTLNQLLEGIDHHLLTPLIGRSKTRRDDEGLVTAFLFHRLFESETPPSSVYPHERTTVGFFEAFVQACRDRGMNFITPKDLAAGKHLGRHNVMITFDDGYADNLRALPILERLGAKATFFVAPAHIEENRRFWCDAVWSQGERDLAHFQALPHAQAQNEIEQRWPGALHSPTDDDRPMNLDEFKRLASSPFVEIGHHSHNHTILSPRTRAFIENELQLANAFFVQHMGHAPQAIAYPNGVYSPHLVDVCLQQGLSMGLTCEPRTERLGAKPDHLQRMRLGRYSVMGTRSIDKQLSSAFLERSSKSAVYQFKRQLNRWKSRSNPSTSYDYGQ